MIGVWFIHKSTIWRNKEWDLKTTTISDYVIKYDIPVDFYENFDFKSSNKLSKDARTDQGRDYEDDDLFESKLYCFKKYLKRELEERLKQEDFVIKDSDSLIEISDITFMFQNTEIIDMLINRSGVLYSGNDDKILRYENQIRDYIKSNGKQISIPKEAFITFKTEEAYMRALRFDKTRCCGITRGTEQWKGHTFELEAVDEPSNIYWENSDRYLFIKIIKMAIVVFLLVGLLILFMWFLFYIQRVAGFMRIKYPDVD